MSLESRELIRESDPSKSLRNLIPNISSENVIKLN